MPDYFLKGEKMEEKKIGKLRIVVFLASVALLAVVIVPSAINRFKYPNETSKRVPLPVHEFTDSRNIDVEIIDFN